MKTTIDIADSLLAEAKRRASRDRTTLRAVMDAALRRYLVSEERAARAFRLPDRSVDGEGVSPGLSEGDWGSIRGLIYESRGA